MNRWLTEEQAAAHEAKMRRLKIPLAGETSPAVDRDNRAKVEAAALLVPYERDIQSGILQLLALHPRVAWAARFNVGGAEFQGKDKTYRVRFAFKGCSDILGMLVGGRFLAIEVKRPGEKLTEDQEAFLKAVNMGGGLGIAAWSVDDVARSLLGVA